MRLVTIIFLTIILISSCGRKSEFEGFSKSKKGFHYQLHTIGESIKKTNPGDYITADISYQTINDSLFFEGRRKLRIEQPAYKGAIEDCFMMLRADESATFIIKAEPFFKQTLGSELPSFLTVEDYIKINISIVEIQTATEFENEKQAFLNWVEDFGDYEKVILSQFLREEKLNISNSKSGLIYLPLATFDVPRIQLGDTITINYEGKFLNGKFFDSTKRRNQPFSFVYGTEWQVIKGLEKGLALMGEGEKAIFILPSELAFGTSGSSTGIIPTFTSLIFEVEILKVSQGKGPQ
jgi:FKBP-type peptidyl-prolyl cis-trans isomerase FkpA